MRTPARDLRLGPYTLPAGTLININLGVMGNSALNYESPDLYLPVGPAKSSRFGGHGACTVRQQVGYCVLAVMVRRRVSCLLTAASEILRVVLS